MLPSVGSTTTNVLLLLFHFHFHGCSTCCVFQMPVNASPTSDECSDSYYVQIPFGLGGENVIAALSIHNQPCPLGLNADGNAPALLKKIGTNIVQESANEFCASSALGALPTCAEIVNELAWRELISGAAESLSPPAVDSSWSEMNLEQEKQYSVDGLRSALTYKQKTCVELNARTVNVAIVSFANPALLESLLAASSSFADVKTVFHLFDENCNPSSTIQSLRERFGSDKLILKCGDLKTTMLLEVGNPLMMKDSVFDYSVVDVGGERSYDDEVAMLTRLSGASRVGSRVQFIDCQVCDSI